MVASMSGIEGRLPHHEPEVVGVDDLIRSTSLELDAASEWSRSRLSFLDDVEVDLEPDDRPDQVELVADQGPELPEVIQVAREDQAGESLDPGTQFRASYDSSRVTRGAGAHRSRSLQRLAREIVGAATGVTERVPGARDDLMCDICTHFAWTWCVVGARVPQ